MIPEPDTTPPLAVPATYDARAAAIADLARMGLAVVDCDPATGMIAWASTCSPTQAQEQQATAVVRARATPPTVPVYDLAHERCDWRDDLGRFEVWAVADYAALRAPLYPPLADLADAVAKQADADPATVAQGRAQQAAYQARCLAVKARYPKPLTPAEVPHVT